jgi:hypothetical protein
MALSTSILLMKLFVVLLLSTKVPFSLPCPDLHLPLRLRLPRLRRRKR